MKEEKNIIGEVIRRVERRPIPVVTRRTVYRTLIVTPKGEESELEESQEEPPAGKTPSGNLVQRFISTVFPKPKDLIEGEEEEPEEIERRVTDRFIRYEDGSEEMIDQYEMINSLEVPAVKTEPVTQRVTDRMGRVIKTVVVRRVYVTVKTVVIRRVIENPDGTEVEIEKSYEEIPDSYSEEPPSTERSITHRVTSNDFPEIVEETDDISPLELSFKQGDTKETENVLLNDSKTVKYTSEVTTKKLITRKTVEYPGKKKVAFQEPVEDVYTIPVEVGQTCSMPEQTEEIKDDEGNIIKRIVQKHKPVQTRRMVYKKIVYTPEEAKSLQSPIFTNAIDGIAPSKTETVTPDDGDMKPGKGIIKRPKRPNDEIPDQKKLPKSVSPERKTSPVRKSAKNEVKQFPKKDPSKKVIGRPKAPILMQRNQGRKKENRSRN